MFVGWAAIMQMTNLCVSFFANYATETVHLFCFLKSKAKYKWEQTEVVCSSLNRHSRHPAGG